MVISVVDFLLFILFGVPVCYLAFFAFASVYRKPEPEPTSETPHSFLILIPAFKEDGVILDCVDACLKQDYPKDRFDVVVIAEGMNAETLERL
ncbi:MAG: glycosyltransferase, partial [Bacteroidales bacterium]